MANFNIQKFSADGKFLNSLGSKGSEYGQLASPHDLPVNSNINSHVVERDDLRVLRFSLEVEPLNAWGTTGSDNDHQFLDPHSIVVGT
ncbi:MAG TPA: hypothetical protein VFY50_01450 [Candidatus Nitrosocosmicus sp.]|nr:hypothetical protein [Candidatus Nitrosocosmicus sp.]